jgi:plasmid replication initiation protein
MLTEHPQEQNEQAIAIKYNKDYYVALANELLTSRQDRMSIFEARLIRLAIAQVVKDDTDLKTYTCKITDLADFFGKKRSNLYRDIQKVSKNLMKRNIYIKEKETGKRGQPNYKIFHWVDYFEYKDGVITFKLSENLKPYLIGLNEYFTKYGYGCITGLDTYDSLRLFELLTCYKFLLDGRPRNEVMSYLGDIPIERDELIFSIDFLKEFFDDNNEKYAYNTADFISRRIDVSIKPIEEQYKMNVSYRVIKTAGAISHVVFKIRDYQDETIDKVYEVLGLPRPDYI